MTDLIVLSGVKEALADQNVSVDFYAALDNAIGEHIDVAARRAEANAQKIVQPRDL